MHHTLHVCSKQRRYNTHYQWYLYFTNIYLCTIFFPSVLCLVPNRIHGSRLTRDYKQAKCVSVTALHNVFDSISLSHHYLFHPYGMDTVCFPGQYLLLRTFCTRWNLKLSQQFEGICCVHLQIGHPENDGSKFFRNVCKFIPDYIMSDPRRQY